MSNNIPNGIDYIISVLFDVKLKGYSVEEVINKIDKYSIVRIASSEGHLFNTIKKVLTKIEAMDKGHSVNPIMRLYNRHIGTEGIVPQVLIKSSFADTTLMKLRTQELLGNAFYFKHAPGAFTNAILRTVGENMVKVFGEIRTAIKSKKTFSHEEIDYIIGWITLFGSTFFTKQFKDIQVADPEFFGSYLKDGITLCLTLLGCDNFRKFPNIDSYENMFSSAVDECFGDIRKAIGKGCDNAAVTEFLENSNSTIHKLYIGNFYETFNDYANCK